MKMMHIEDFLQQQKIKNKQKQNKAEHPPTLPNQMYLP